MSKDPPHREMDMLLTARRAHFGGIAQYGACGPFSGCTFLYGLASRALSRQRVIAAQESSGYLGDRIRGALASGKVAIVAGFQGVSETKEITTFCRWFEGGPIQLLSRLRQL